jgi:hypothetical protein
MSGTDLAARGKRGASVRAGEKGSGPARGPCGGGREERGPGGRKKKGERKLGRANGVWVTAVFSSFLFIFYTQTIQTNPFEFK